MNARQTQIQRARATAYLEQQRLRDGLVAKVDRAIDVDPRKAYLAWQANMAEADAFVRWLMQQKAPPDCASLVAWITRNPDIAFSAYNPYLQRLARDASAAASGLDAGAAEVAAGMARMLKKEGASNG